MQTGSIATRELPWFAPHRRRSSRCICQRYTGRQRLSDATRKARIIRYPTTNGLVWPCGRTKAFYCMYVEFLPRLRRDIDAGKIHAKAYTRTQPLFGPPRRSLDKPSLREQLMSNPEKALPASPRAISIACALVTWAGVQIAGVGLFDRVNFHSEISQTLLTTGALLFVGGLIGLSLIRLLGPLHDKKLWFFTIGLTH